jgi:RNA polymerase sigma factor (sigma-70 family)
MKQFNTSNEELKKIGQEFNSRALTLTDDIYNLSFWLVLKERIAKKIVWITYKKAIYYCDKTRADSDWHTWLHRIFMNRIFDYYNEKKEADNINFKSIDRWNADSNLITRIKEENSIQISEKKIIKYFKKLPQNLSLSLVLKDIYNFPYQSIGEYLNVPDGVIASRIYRARKLFFMLLTEEKSAIDLNVSGEYPDETYIPIENLKEIALLIDNPSEEYKSKVLKNKSYTEPRLKTEFEIQNLIKSGLNKSISKKNAPISLKRKIEKEAEKRFLSEI